MNAGWQLNVQKMSIFIILNLFLYNSFKIVYSKFFFAPSVGFWDCTDTMDHDLPFRLAMYFSVHAVDRLYLISRNIQRRIVVVIVGISVVV